MKIRIFAGKIAAGAVGAAMAASVITLAPSASAAERCPEQSVCVYRDAGFTGPMYSFPANNYVTLNKVEYKFGDGTPVNDNISSVINNTTFTFAFYTDQNYGGSYADVLAPRKWTSLVAQNDTISSMRPI
ncbi:peptidase inhibitor family I36 protein [Streptomyces beigongshangae]|uniref:peptidase inhibitor family I36 protein n=1 Tax=Streptomyces beigongshangae TaxID=2841597 RepID=UPI001C852A2B|nr:peptidase inhibitor family I36 protein [Streptomyces sp. REN17]